MLKIPTQP